MGFSLVCSQTIEATTKDFFYYFCNVFIPGEKTWVTPDLGVSVPCLLWVSVDPEQNEPELLVSGGSDKRLRLWRREEGEEGAMGGLRTLGTFGVQTDTILALVQNSTYLATASGKFLRLIIILPEFSG